MRSTRPHTNTHTHACTLKLTPASELTRGSAYRTSSSPVHSVSLLFVAAAAAGPRSCGYRCRLLTSSTDTHTLSLSPPLLCSFARSVGRAVGWPLAHPTRPYDSVSVSLRHLFPCDGQASGHGGRGKQHTHSFLTTFLAACSAVAVSVHPRSVGRSVGKSACERVLRGGLPPERGTERVRDARACVLACIPLPCPP